MGNIQQNARPNVFVNNLLAKVHETLHCLQSEWGGGILAVCSISRHLLSWQTSALCHHVVVVYIMYVISLLSKELVRDITKYDKYGDLVLPLALFIFKTTPSTTIISGRRCCLFSPSVYSGTPSTHIWNLAFFQTDRYLLFFFLSFLVFSIFWLIIFSDYSFSFP